MDDWGKFNGREQVRSGLEFAVEYEMEMKEGRIRDSKFKGASLEDSSLISCRDLTPSRLHHLKCLYSPRIVGIFMVYT